MQEPEIVEAEVTEVKTPKLTVCRYHHPVFDANVNEFCPACVRDVSKAGDKRIRKTQRAQQILQALPEAVRAKMITEPKPASAGSNVQFVPNPGAV